MQLKQHYSKQPATSQKLISESAYISSNIRCMQLGITYWTDVSHIRNNTGHTNLVHVTHMTAKCN